MELLYQRVVGPKIFSPTVIIRDGKGCAAGACRPFPHVSADMSPPADATDSGQPIDLSCQKVQEHHLDHARLDSQLTVEGATVVYRGQYASSPGSSFDLQGTLNNSNNVPVIRPPAHQNGHPHSQSPPLRRDDSFLQYSHVPDAVQRQCVTHHGACFVQCTGSGVRGLQWGDRSDSVSFEHPRPPLLSGEKATVGCEKRTHTSPPTRRGQLGWDHPVTAVHLTQDLEMIHHGRETKQTDDCACLKQDHICCLQCNVSRDSSRLPSVNCNGYVPERCSNNCCTVTCDLGKTTAHKAALFHPSTKRCITPDGCRQSVCSPRPRSSEQTLAVSGAPGCRSDEKPHATKTDGGGAPGMLVYHGIWTVIAPSQRLEHQEQTGGICLVCQSPLRMKLSQCPHCWPVHTHSVNRQKLSEELSGAHVFDPMMIPVSVGEDRPERLVGQEPTEVGGPMTSFAPTVRSKMPESTLSVCSSLQEKPYDLTTKPASVFVEQDSRILLSNGCGQCTHTRDGAEDQRVPVHLMDRAGSHLDQKQHTPVSAVDIDQTDFGHKHHQARLSLNLDSVPAPGLCEVSMENYVLCPETTQNVRVYTDLDKVQATAAKKSWTSLTQGGMMTGPSEGKVMMSLSHRDFLTEKQPDYVTTETEGKTILDLKPVEFTNTAESPPSTKMCVLTKGGAPEGSTGSDHRAWRGPAQSEGSDTQSRSVKRKRSRSRTFPCPLCSVACSNRGQLLGHLRTHTGERPFPCPEPGCSKTFVRNEELTRHRRIHSGERPYACSTCSKAFTRKDHLNKHVRVHDLDLVT